ncbi:tetratricopeptide repeat protein [Bdellovibrionota bacterium FG-2]
MAALYGFFDGIAKHTRGAALGVGAMLVIGVAIAFFMNHREETAASGRNALYAAHKSIEGGIKSMADAETPPPQPASSPMPVGAPKAAEKDLGAWMFKRFDVDAKLSEGVKKLQEVSTKFKGTRAGFEADLELGNLYFNHGEPLKAVSWFEKAALGAPSIFERALAYSSQGNALENGEKFSDAVQAYEKALNLGEETLKGDLLLAMARCYEGAKEFVKAKGVYDRIIKELPSKEHAKSAETYKSQIE